MDEIVSVKVQESVTFSRNAEEKDLCIYGHFCSKYTEANKKAAYFKNKDQEHVNE